MCGAALTPYPCFRTLPRDFLTICNISSAFLLYDLLLSFFMFISIYFCDISLVDVDSRLHLHVLNDTFYDTVVASTISFGCAYFGYRIAQ
ncbi:hypothetical protein GDO81_000404 [Engystomops pustulosus]|uniref:Uncharacterized protein n=1 Tax=Engystomops pustulosus TaxID=76066 RepID=A0AAV7D4K8_ENGPU|nr:hypothetical protein GDO81_000404 [Engystomops pustulosus]